MKKNSDIMRPHIVLFILKNSLIKEISERKIACVFHMLHMWSFTASKLKYFVRFKQ